MHATNITRLIHLDLITLILGLQSEEYTTNYEDYITHIFPSASCTYMFSSPYSETRESSLFS